MCLLDRYLLWGLVVPLLYCLVGFLVFWVTFDLFGELEGFRDGGLGFWGVVLFYWGRLPELLSVVIPVALLLGLLYALSCHGRYNELVALRAAGWSVWRLCGVYFGVGVFFSLVLFWVNEVWAGRGSVAEGDGVWRGPVFIDDEGSGRSWVVERFNWESGEMLGVSVSWDVREGVGARMVADSGGLTNGVWTFGNVTVFYVDGGVGGGGLGLEVTNSVVAGFGEFDLTLEEVRSELRVGGLLDGVGVVKGAEVSLGEIGDYLALHPGLSGLKRARLDTQFWGRLAWPWTCLVVVLVAVPFGMGVGGRGAFVGVASSLVICFVYFVLLRVGLALGSGGRLWPWLGAWLPNLVFGGGAGWLIARMR